LVGWLVGWLVDVFILPFIQPFIHHFVASRTFCSTNLSMALPTFLLPTFLCFYQPFSLGKPPRIVGARFSAAPVKPMVLLLLLLLLLRHHHHQRRRRRLLTNESQVPGAPVHIPRGVLTPKQIDAFLVRMRIDEIRYDTKREERGRERGSRERRVDAETEHVPRENAN